METDAEFVWLSLDGKAAMISRGKKLLYKGKVVLEQDASSGIAVLDT